MDKSPTYELSTRTVGRQPEPSIQPLLPVGGDITTNRPSDHDPDNPTLSDDRTIEREWTWTRTWTWAMGMGNEHGHGQRHGQGHGH
jgi:hypothetical protein